MTPVSERPASEQLVSEAVTESFIDGAPVRSAETYPNIDPSTGAVLGDVARAVLAEDWSWDPLPQGAR